MSNGSDKSYAAFVELKTRADAAGKAAYDTVYKSTGNPLSAYQAQVRATSDIMTHGSAARAAMSVVFSGLNDVLAAFFGALSDARQDISGSMGDTTAEVLNEFL